MAQIPRVFGTVARGFGPMRKAFVENFQRGEVGASLCVFYRGQLVVDLWGIAYLSLSIAHRWCRWIRR